MRAGLLAVAVVCACAAPAIGAQAEDAPPLVLEATIPLPDVAGRIDHLAIDLGRKRLLVAELGNGTVDVVDLSTKKVVHRIAKLDEPQGVAYLPERDLIAVACGGDGAVRFFDGADFSERGVVQLGSDADNVRLDPRNGTLLVGYGDGGLAVIDPSKLKKVADIPLPAHPEGFQISPSGARIFVNVPDARQIDVIDNAARAVVARWTTPGLSANFPVALDESHRSVAVVFRSPARLVLFEATSGVRKSEVEVCGDADDVFFDARRQRYYVSCGAGAIAVFDLSDAGLRALEQIPTTSGARTSLFVPEADRLYVAMRAGWLGSDAAIRVYRPAP